MTLQELIECAKRTAIVRWEASGKYEQLSYRGDRISNEVGSWTIDHIYAATLINPAISHELNLHKRKFNCEEIGRDHLIRVGDLLI